MPKVVGLRSYKKAKNSKDCGQGKIQKLHRSAVMQKCLKLAILLSRNDAKNAEAPTSVVKEKCQKLAGPW